MTNTEKVLTSTKERRTEWISLLIQAASQIPDPGHPALWEGLILLIDREGDDMASLTNRWWPRRMRWVRAQYNVGILSQRNIVIRALADMKFANDNDGR